MIILIRAALILCASLLAHASAEAANCIQAGGYPYTTNQCINANDLNTAFQLSVSPAPPANLYGQGAFKGKPWLDTSTSPATLRMCANPTGYCATRYVPSDWINEGAIDFTAMAPNWPIGGGSATLVANTLTDLSQTPAAFITISGNANISSLGILPAGQIKLLYFTGTVTLVSGTAIITPGGQTLTTQPGYEAFVVSQTPGVWMLIPVGSIGAGYHSAVNLATAAALPAETYSNGSSGVGATLTENANGALVVDGITAAAGMRILDKNEATAAWNGIYTVTNAGSSSAQYVLTRAADFNTAATGNISNGAVVPVSGGNTLANTSWVLTTTGTITVGTTALTFGPYAQPNVYTAGTGLLLTGNQFSLNATCNNLLDAALNCAVANTTALRGTSTAIYPKGIWRLTDGAAGAPPLFYTAGTGACASDDGGSCINSSNGAHWIGQFPAYGADSRQWGIVADGTTDNATALQKACNWESLAQHGKLVFSSGTIYSSGPCTITPNPAASLEGSGEETTLLVFASGINGLIFNVNTPAQNIHVRDMTIASQGALINNSQPPLATGLFLDDTGPYGALASSDISHVTFRGANGFGQGQCWYTAFNTNYHSFINFIDDNFIGCWGGADGLGSGNGIAVGGSSQPGILYNITSCNFAYLSTGFLYGENVQGVTITQSNFTPDHYGVFNLPNGVGQNQLSISDSQWGYVSFGILEETGILNTTISNNVVSGGKVLSTSDYAGFASINTDARNCTFTGNTIDGYQGAAGAIGITIITGGICAITGNFIGDWATGISLGANTVANVQANVYTNNTTNVASASPANRITGNQPAYYFISAIANNGSGLARATVSSTAGLASGEILLVSPIPGVSNLDIVTSINVIDSTHVDFELIGYTGSPVSVASQMNWLP